MSAPSPSASRALAICLLAAACGRERARSTEGASQPGASASALASPAALAVAPTTDPRTLGWTLGQEFPYRLKLSSAVSFGGQASALDFDLTADVIVIPTAVAANETTLFLAMRKVEVVSRGSSPHAELDKVAEQAGATGTMLTLSGGRVKAIQVAPDLSPMTVGIYRELGSRLQFVHPKPGVAEYEAEEYDTTGRYAAKYSAVAGSHDRYRKQKLRYTSAVGAQPQLFFSGKQVVPQVSKSEITVTLSPDRRPVLVQAHDEVIVNGAQTPVHSSTSVELTALAPVAAQPHDWAAVSGDLVKVAADEVFGAKIPVGATDDARIRGLTYAKVLQRLTALKSAHPEGVNGPAPTDPAGRAASEAVAQESATLFTALSALFRKNPDNVRQAVAAIRARSPVAETLIDALGSSGTSTAHEGLAELIRAKSLDKAQRARALTALARTSTPSKASVDILKALLDAEPFNETALYGLGTQARRLRDAGETEQAGNIAQFLHERFRAMGSSESNLRVMLSAIMNCGCEQVLEDVRPFLNDKRDWTRALAVRALQSMHDPSIDGLIAERLAADSVSDVKIAALEAARVREPTAAVTEVLTKVATTDADARVRYRAVDLLRQWLPKRSDLLPTLAQIAAKDPEPQVRARAQAAL